MSSQLKAKASYTVDSSKEELQQLSSKIWNNPEIGFEEYKAHALLTNFLEKKGFTVEHSYTGIETAFRATFGTGRPNVCVICEYDALPGIGHACGHNLIAEAGIAAGLGLKAALGSIGAPKGRVTVMGTPAEEGGGGKIKLIENGGFEDIDIAMMVHPSPYSVLKVEFVTCVGVKVTYTSVDSNPLDAAVLAYNSISILREQMKSTNSIHGVITNGGLNPNVKPEKTELEYYIRASTRDATVQLYDRVISCFTAAATATGCMVAFEETCKLYDDLRSNSKLAQLYRDNLQTFGITDIKETILEVGSSDMGNVSYIVPSIHPMYAIGSGERYHTREFTDVTDKPEAHRSTLVQAKAMAHTCIDVLTTDGLLEEIKEIHAEILK